MKADIWRYCLSWSQDFIAVRDYLIHIPHFTNKVTEIQRIEESSQITQQCRPWSPDLQSSVLAGSTPLPQ